MSKPKVTIITAVYNLINEKREELFSKCVESVHNQTYQNIEHLIIYTPGEDNTFDLIEKYEKIGWVKIIIEKEKGIYKAFNCGIDEAKGEYILFLNSDDSFCEAKAVEWSVKKLDKTGADFSYADCMMINKSRFNKVFSDNIDSFLCSMPFSHQTMFVKRNVLLEMGKFDMEYQLAADYDLIIRLIFDNKKYCYIPKPIVKFREGGVSFQRSEESRIEYAKIYYDLYSKFYRFINFEQAQGMFLGNSIPSEFTSSFKRFVEKNRLDNMDYSVVYKYLDSKNKKNYKTAKKYFFRNNLVNKFKKTVFLLFKGY
ncbi:MAG: glycosyltransferase family 2 protein [Candidatus Gastranaerophilales bacterium]|nr:glycosyltransferase family 2 protein [Candidatus Gastranaerophilales bacterium]